MHMLAAISRIYEPGIKYDIMLCLVGSQGAGKSTFFKRSSDKRRMVQRQSGSFGMTKIFTENCKITGLSKWEK